MNRMFLLILLLSSAFSIKNCVDEATFKKANSKTLNGSSLVDLFKNGYFLGAGSFGKVVEVNWGGMPIAIKEIKKPTDPNEIFQTENELTFMKEMSGKKAAVEFYGCVEITGYLYIFQESLYKDFESASLLLNYKRKDVEDRIKVFRNILSKFSILHKANIIHEDGKPDNFMSVDEELSDFRIIDFGLSSHLGEPVHGGSPAFNGEEKVKFLKEKVKGFPEKADPRHDIYALGLSFAVLESKLDNVFRGLSSKCFMSNYTDDCYKKLMKNVENVLVKTGMGAMISVIKKATMKNYEERYANVDLMIEDIDTILDKMEEDNKSLVVDEDLTDIMKSKNEAEREAENEKKYEKERGYLNNDDYFKENRELFKTQVKRPIQQEEEVNSEEQEIKKEVSPLEVPQNYYNLPEDPRRNEQQEKNMKRQKQFTSPNQKDEVPVIGPRYNGNYLNQLSPREDVRDYDENGTKKSPLSRSKSNGKIKIFGLADNNDPKAIEPTNIYTDRTNQEYYPEQKAETKRQLLREKSHQELYPTNRNFNPEYYPKTEEEAIAARKAHANRVAAKKHDRDYSAQKSKEPLNTYKSPGKDVQTKPLKVEKEKSNYEEAKQRDKEFAFINGGIMYFWDPYKKEYFGVPTDHGGYTQREKPNTANKLRRNDTKENLLYNQNEYGFNYHGKIIII